MRAYSRLHEFSLPELIGSEQIFPFIYARAYIAAKTPSEALRLAADYRKEIPLLLVDVVMPEMTGGDLEKYLVSLHPNLRTLFMSGYTANAIAHRGVLEEGVFFVQKPFSQRDLAIKIRAALENSR